MPKRFSETDKWNDEWFAELKPLQKLVFLFMVDRCDNAGFMEINTRINSFLIGITHEQYEGAIKGLSKCIVISKDRKKLWLKNFLKHQKNLPLNFENNAHKNIIYLIEENKENFDFSFENLGANQGLISPIGKGKGKGKGIGKEGGVGETEEIGPELWTTIKKNFFEDGPWQFKFCTEKNISLERLDQLQKDFIKNIELREDFKNLKELKSHFTNLFNKNKKNGTDKPTFKGSSNSKSAGRNILADEIANDITGFN